MRLGQRNVGVDYDEKMSGVAVGINQYNATVKTANSRMQYRTSGLAQARVNTRRTAEGVRRIASDLRILGILSDDSYKLIKQITAFFMLSSYALMMYQSIHVILLAALKSKMIWATLEAAAHAVARDPWLLVAAGVATNVGVALGGVALYNQFKVERHKESNTWNVDDRREYARRMKEAQRNAAQYE